MASRRRFLELAGLAGAALGVDRLRSSRGDEKPSAQDGTWLTYAVNVEMFWNNLPFLDRLRKVNESGFSHYEFWPWRNKDIDAIARLNQELGLHPAQFSASPKRFDQGITDPGRKDEFVDDITKAVEVAKRLNVKKLCVVAGEETVGYSPEQQTRAVIDALKAGARVVEPADVTIILEPLNILVDHPKQHVVHSAHAADVLRQVGSAHVKMLFDIYHQQISEGNLTGNIRAYSDLIGYYQLADHPGRHEPGTGEIAYDHILQVVHDVGYQGAIGLELSPKYEPIAALNAVRRADQRAKNKAWAAGL